MISLRRCAAAAALLALATTGCSSFGDTMKRDSWVRVKPWERDLLAREDMAWDPSPLQATFRSHIFFSKEASLAGGSAGGGGCGCN